MRLLGCIILGAIAAAGGFSRAAEQPAMLHLAGDAFATGALRASDDPKVLRWQSPAFAQPFGFLLDAVKGVHFPALSAPPKPEGEYCFELVGGDVLFGSLVRLDEDQAQIDAARYGRLNIRRDRIRSLYRWNVAELVYLGPNGMAGWKEPHGAKDWTDQLGQPMTDARGAALFGDLSIPSKAIVEFELSWKTKPDFSLAFGADENAGSSVRPFRFEVLWRSQPASAMLLADARQADPIEWEYTLTDPGPTWFEPAYKPRGWSVGPAGFGTHGTPGAIVRTEWSTDEIWLRRRFHVKDEKKSIALSVHHDEDVRVWINGRLVHSAEGHRSGYTVVPLDGAANVLRKGENTIAVHCRQTGGGQYVDVGIIDQGTPTQGDLVAVRETEQEAVVAAVKQVNSTGGRIHLVAYLDQKSGRMLVFAPGGTQIADLKVDLQTPKPSGGLWLTNHSGDVRLERLRISRWNGVPPDEVQVEKPRLNRIDGSIVYGQLVAVDTNAKQFIVKNGLQETRVPADQVASIVSTPRSTESAVQSQREFRVVYQDGTQLGGELRRVEEDSLVLVSHAFDEPLRLPLDGLRSFVVLKRDGSAPRPETDGRTGMLETDGLRLPGRLTDTVKESQAGALVWRPDHSATASPLRHDVAGTITYRQPSPPMPKRSRIRRPAGFTETIFTALFGNKDTEPLLGTRRSLHLRNGDIIPCEVSGIDEKGVRFTSPMSHETFVPHDRIKAVELVLAQSPPKLNKDKWQRLLTLPRMQTPSPPTHLIRSKAGDFLRGNLIAMDEKKLTVEVRTEAKEIPRDRVSHIIWLHADELLSPPASPTAPTPPAQAAARAHVRQSDGNRLTFQPQRLTGTTLSGTSDVLGVCHADLTQADQLLIGGAIQKAATEAAYHRWKLQRAIDPKYIQALAEPGPKAQAPGTSSALVGKPAPDFELQLLDGKKFRLATTKGRVIVLDFWATWCGPCLQLMPQIDRVVREFEGQKVELVAINLEEPPSLITSILERHKLQLTVALDRDGIAAAKYEATAIPHTVIIDQDGKIARIFIGGGPQVADHVRDALRNLLFARNKDG